MASAHAQAMRGGRCEHRDDSRVNAPERCALPRVEFLFRAGRMKVPVADLDGDELELELMDA